MKRTLRIFGKTQGFWILNEPVVALRYVVKKLSGVNKLASDLQGRFASNNSPAGFSSASSNSSQTIGGFDSLFSKRGGGGSTGGAHHGGSNPLSSLINGGSGSGQGNCDNNSSIYDKWSNGNNSSSGGLFRWECYCSYHEMTSVEAK